MGSGLHPGLCGGLVGRQEHALAAIVALLAELPYVEEGASLFAHIAQQHWAVFLDSGRPFSKAGRYDILTADPFLTLETRGATTEIRNADSVQVFSDDPFRLLQARLADYQPARCELPFAGGAVGYFAYDLGRRLEKLPTMARDAEQVPEMAVGIYDWAVVLDHADQRAWLVGQGFDKRTRERWQELCAMFSRPVTADKGDFHLTSPVVSNMDQAAYAQAFSRVQDYIRAGDCYQVNLAQRFAACAEGDPWVAYRLLRESSPAPFATYLNTPQARVLSNSPERFLRVIDGCVETRPIKGTRPRAANPEQDRTNAEELCASLKDRAENLMIVDLLRNDIGKNCVTGSVKVEKLFELESFANVHHLVSTIGGCLAPGRDALDLLRGCFPGGSITGAPKLRAMQIIEELEPNRRGIYCGAIGYIGFDGNMDTSIAIRTAIHSHGEIRFWAGGGIVADSEVAKEYDETLDKALPMLQLAEKLGGCRVGG